MLTFAREKLPPIWPEILRMGREHWEETEGYRHGLTFNPDAYRYFQFNELPGVGELPFYSMFTARDGGKLAGYAGMYVTRSMHTQDVMATEDTWFLLPEYRKGRNALAFYKYIEEICRANGVIEIGMTAKLENGAGRILEYLGYTHVSRQYSKFLQHRADSATSDPVEFGAAMSENRDVRTLSTSTP